MAILRNVMVYKGTPIGFRVAVWHQPGCVWRRWLNHLVLVTAGGAPGWVWGLFGMQPEGFWSPMRAHMGPARKRLAMRAAPAISPWLCLACPLIHPSMNDSFQPPHSSHSVTPQPSHPNAPPHSLSQLFQPSGIIRLSATWQRPTRFVAGQTFN